MWGDIAFGDLSGILFPVNSFTRCHIDLESLIGRSTHFFCRNDFIFTSIWEVVIDRLHVLLLLSHYLSHLLTCNRTIGLGGCKTCQESTPNINQLTFWDIILILIDLFIYAQTFQICCGRHFWSVLTTSCSLGLKNQTFEGLLQSRLLRYLERLNLRY